MRTTDGGRRAPTHRSREARPFRSTLLALLVAAVVAAAAATAQPAPSREAAGRTAGEGAAAASAPAASLGVISNGTLRLGVNPHGNLDVFADELGPVGLEYLPTGADALVPGCWCEGWGVADTASATSGWASVANGGVSPGLSVTSFTVGADTAESVVEVGSRLRVGHRYHPSARPELYQVDLRVENLGSTAARVVYRRVMDWDVAPTEFSELVTIQGAHPALLSSTDDGFAHVDPLRPLTDLGTRGTFADVGPGDRGAAFDLSLGELAPGASVTLTMFYGAAATEADALAALAAVDADLYSLGQPGTSDGGRLGTPNTFVFGITDGVAAGGPVIARGRLVLPSSGTPLDDGPTAISGSVGLYLPSRSAASPSEDVLVAAATTEADGTFVLRSPSTAALAAEAALNGGAVNLDLLANVDGYTYHEPIIRSFVAGAWVDDHGADPPELVASPLTSQTNPRLVPGSAGGATTGSLAFASGCVRYRFPVDARRAWTTIGELHTPADTEVASFRYGERADSHISKAVSLDGNVWVLKGMVKVGTEAAGGGSTVVGITTPNDRWARELQTEFVYTRYHSERWCGVPAVKVEDHYEIKPTDWVGSFRTGADLRHLDDRCYQDHLPYLASFGRHGRFERDSERYGTFVRAATLSVGGASIALNSRSGLSRWVRISLDFGTKTDKHVLCGTDALVPRSSRIFAGA